ncbi:MAG: ThiF family adenylyltransferase [Candidatus Thiodiazotropha endolucinida]
MLRSAYRLLVGEAARQTDSKVLIPSRHKKTQGQQQRGEFVRFIMTSSVQSALKTVADNKLLVAHFIVISHEKTWTVFLTKLERVGDDPLEFVEIPNDLKNYGRSSLGLVKGGVSDTLISAIQADEGALTTYLEEQTLPIPEGEPEMLSPDRVEFVLMRDENDAWKLSLRWDHRSKVWACSTLLPDTSPGSERLAPESKVLASTTVAIVGLGSAGSKIAVSLARTGVGQFILIDDDLLHPGNLVRHDCDWSQIGQHKVDAIGSRLALINPRVEVTRHCVRLVGQESATTIATAISSLSRALVIIDATANPTVFNMCAHVARQSHRSLVWLEVYAGGLGGLVARARPDRDPEPFTLRQAINDAAGRIASIKDVEPPQAGTDYDIEQDNQPPIIATDAEVSIIANLASQFVVDTLIEREPSRFPNPAYLVGLQRQWIFDQPLQVFPVESSETGSWSSTPTDDDPMREGGIEFVQQLILDLIDRDNDHSAS